MASYQDLKILIGKIRIGEMKSLLHLRGGAKRTRSRGGAKRLQPPRDDARPDPIRSGETKLPHRKLLPWLLILVLNSNLSHGLQSPFSLSTKIPSLIPPSQQLPTLSPSSPSSKETARILSTPSVTPFHHHHTYF